MSNISNSNSNNIVFEYVDNGKKVVIFCKTCQKKLETYRKIRYHFATVHEINDAQFSKISKIGRLL